MKNIHKLMTGLVGAAVIGGAVLLTNSSTTTKRVTIPKNNDGGLYKPKLSNYLKPGDTLELEGDYAYINFDSLRGTKEKPIIIVNKGIVRIGTNNSYAWIMTNSKYFKIIGSLVSTDKYPFKIGGPVAGKYIAQSFTFPTSDEFEITGVELLNAQVGFFANPSSGLYKNISIHDNYVHDLDNPAESGRSEGVYIGNTSFSTTTTGGHFDSLHIYNTRFENLAGDGIQVALTSNMNIHDNIIKGYGKANLEQQRSAIIIGGCSSGKVYNNNTSDGTGAAFQIFGGGDVYLTNNTATNVASSANEDGIYIDGKCKDAALRVYIIGNTIVGKVARDYVRDASKSVVENKSNAFGAITTPTPTPVKKVITKIVTTIYEDGTFEATKQ